MSGALYDDMANYLAIRKKELTLPSFALYQRVLLSFDQHLEKRGKRERSVTEDDVFTWLQPKYAVLSRATIATQVCCLRKFSEYLRQQGVTAYVPPSVRAPDNYIPHLFTDEEIAKIFEAADSLQLPRNAKANVELPMLSLIHI